MSWRWFCLTALAIVIERRPGALELFRKAREIRGSVGRGGLQLQCALMLANRCGAGTFGLMRPSALSGGWSQECPG